MVGLLEICCASQAHCHCKICCAFTTSVKRKMEPPFCFRLYIIYRAIHNIGLYNWHLQKGIAEVPLMYNCISIYGYTLQSRRARCKAIHLYPCTFIHAITLYIYTWYKLYMPISTISVYKLYTYTLYILIHTITLYGEYTYTRYLLIQDIPLYVVEVYMAISLYSSIVYWYAIALWLYKMCRHGTSIQFGVCTIG